MILTYDEILTLQSLVNFELFECARFDIDSDYQIKKREILNSLKVKLQDYAVNTISIDNLRSIDNVK